MKLKQIILFSSFIGTFFLSGCEQTPKEDVELKPTYQLVKKVEIKDSERAYIEVFGSKNNIIVDFNQRPGDSLHGVEELITQFGSDPKVLYNSESKTLYFYKLGY